MVLVIAAMSMLMLPCATIDDVADAAFADILYHCLIVVRLMFFPRLSDFAHSDTFIVDGDAVNLLAVDTLSSGFL